MSGLFQKVMKGGEGDSNAQGDSDFADFAPPTEQVAVPQADPVSQQATVGSAVPYTKWYRVWERTSPTDFVQEAFVIPFIIVVIICHVWGTRKNRRYAKAWAQAHIPVLQDEFAVVGYKGVPHKPQSADDITIDGKVFTEKSPSEFTTYATGRQNIAFVDVNMKLAKRFNPLLLFGDSIIGVLFDSLAGSGERVEIYAYAFDGQEKDLVPSIPGDGEQPEKRSKANNSSYDGFVFAIAHKNSMRKLREERYDVSLAPTKDHQKLPEWVTVMSENAQITDMIVTPDVIKAIEDVGDQFEYLIITDQPAEKPTKLDEIAPRKRSILSLRPASSSSPSAYDESSTLLKTFIRLSDRLVASAHFRPEVARKLRNTREEEVKKLKRVDEDEKAEERKLAAEKVKKQGRERLLRGMSAEEQRKYLEKEKEREQKRGLKKGTKRA